MLQIFRTNQILLGVLLLVYAIVLRSASFYIPNTFVAEGYGPLYQWILDFQLNQTTSSIIATVLIVAQGVLLSQLILAERLSIEPSLFAGAFFILLSSFSQELLLLSPVILINTCLMGALWNAYKIYKQKSAAGYLFNIGFWIGLAVLFQASSVIFLLFGIIAINVLRSISTKEILMVFTGVVVPLFIAGTYYFWNDRLFEFQTLLLGGLSFLSFETLDYYELLMLGLMALLVLFGVLNYGVLIQKRNIKAQKQISLLFILLILAGISILIQYQASAQHMGLVAIPIAVAMAFTFLNISKRPIADFLYLLLFVSISLFHWRSYFL